MNEIKNKIKINNKNKIENENEDLDGYDSFQIMISQISHFKDRYHSFTTGKTYMNLLGQTASGLLKDAAAKTAELSLEQRKQHEYSLNVFAAFCMYFCLTKIRDHYGKNVAYSRGGDVVNTVYRKVLKHIREDLETNGESRNVRNLIKRSAVNAMKDIFEKGERYVGIGEGSDDDFGKLSEQLIDDLLAGMESVRHDFERMEALERAIYKASKQKVLTKDELRVICHFYGYGNGFEKLSNHEIAQKLGCSDGAATKLRKKALEKLYLFLKETPEFNEIFF